MLPEGRGTSVWPQPCELAFLKPGLSTQAGCSSGSRHHRLSALHIFSWLVLSIVSQFPSVWDGSSVISYHL